MPTSDWPKWPSASRFVFLAVLGLSFCYWRPPEGQSDPTWESIQLPLWLLRKVPELPCQHPKAQPRVFWSRPGLRALVSIVVCAAFFVYITKSYFITLNLYLTTNMISVTDTMIVQVYKRPQNACLVTLTCLQHPPCSPGGVRVQNPCMLKVCSHLDTPTKSAVDVIMCPHVVRCVYLGTHLPLGLVQWVFIRYLELKYKQIPEWLLPFRHVERSKMIGPWNKKSCVDTGL